MQHESQIMTVMSNQSFEMNSVKEAGSNSGEGLFPGRCLAEQPGVYHCTIVIVLLWKEVGGESGLKKLIEL